MKTFTELTETLFGIELTVNNIDKYIIDIIELNTLYSNTTTTKENINDIELMEDVLISIETQLEAIQLGLIEDAKIKIADKASKIAEAIKVAQKQGFNTETKGVNLLSIANKATKSLSGVCRHAKAFKEEFRLPLLKVGLDSSNLTPYAIKQNWAPDLIIDGSLFESKTVKNKLYNDELATLYGVLYTNLIKPNFKIISEVSDFTINKVIKYCK